MFLKVVLFALCAILGLAQIANAATPACLLAVVGQTKNPADLKDICNDRAMPGKIEEQCKEADQVKAGLDTFSSICLSAGFTVPINAKTSSPSPSTSAFETATPQPASTFEPPASAFEPTVTCETAISSKIVPTSEIVSTPKIFSTSKIVSTPKIIASTSKIASKTANATSSYPAFPTKTTSSRIASKTANATSSANISTAGTTYGTAYRTVPAATVTGTPGATSTSMPSAGGEPYYGTVNAVQTVLLSLAIGMLLLLAW